MIFSWYQILLLLSMTLIVWIKKGENTWLSVLWKNILCKIIIPYSHKTTLHVFLHPLPNHQWPYPFIGFQFVAPETEILALEVKFENVLVVVVVLWACGGDSDSEASQEVERFCCANRLGLGLCCAIYEKLICCYRIYNVAS